MRNFLLYTHKYSCKYFKLFNAFILFLLLASQVSAQQYRLEVGNKSECEIHVRTILCENEVGPDFYVHSMDQEEIAANVKFQRVEIYTVFPTGEVLTYAVVSLWELFPLEYPDCGEDYFPILLPNDCINKGDYNVGSNGKLFVGVWRE